MPLSDRKIGDVSVAPIGFGAMGMSAFYGTGSTDEEAFKVCVVPYL
jgi:aryl-alcohol dehydrogenase-like predicted oxidoreductase